MNGQSDELLCVNEVARALRPRPTAAAVYRWIHRGVRCPDGRRAYLNTTRIGGRYWVRWGDVRAFLAKIAPEAGRGQNGAERAASGSGRAVKRRSHEHTMARLVARLGPIPATTG